MKDRQLAGTESNLSDAASARNDVNRPVIERRKGFGSARMASAGGRLSEAGKTRRGR